MCPGQLCSGTEVKNANVKDSRSYCEGMSYRQSDTALNHPITDNPHAAGSSCADAWDAGWTVADDATGGNISNANAGCCALRGAAVTI